LRILDAHCLFGRWPQEKKDASVERLLECLSSLKIEKGLALSLRGVFFDHNDGNAETLETCAQHPELEPVATIRPAAYGQGDSLPARLAEQGFRMVRLFPDRQGWSADGILAERVYAECAECGLPVAVVVGKKAGIATAAARYAPEGCQVILSQVYYSTLAECAQALRRRPEFVLEVGRTSMPYSLEFLCAEVGADRLVLGTRQPLELGRGSIEMVLNAEIPEGARAGILGVNLGRLLGGI
jgi:predicted TIM-barrel fold metal-dependent hydrolase